MLTQLPLILSVNNVGKDLRGEKEAVKHAEETGHTAFGQIPAEEEG